MNNRVKRAACSAVVTVAAGMLIAVIDSDGSFQLHSYAVGSLAGVFALATCPFWRD